MKAILLLSLISTFCSCSSAAKSKATLSDQKSEEIRLPQQSARLEKVLAFRNEYFIANRERIELAVDQSVLAVIVDDAEWNDQHSIWKLIDKNTVDMSQRKRISRNLYLFNKDLLLPKDQLDANARAGLLPHFANVYRSQGAHLIATSSISAKATSTEVIDALKQRLLSAGVEIISVNNLGLKLKLNAASGFADELDAVHSFEGEENLQWIEPDFIRSNGPLAGMGVGN